MEKLILCYKTQKRGKRHEVIATQRSLKTLKKVTNCSKGFYQKKNPLMVYMLHIKNEPLHCEKLCLSLSGVIT